MKDEMTIKKDRLRFTKNKMSANLSYLAILFNVLFFVSIYSSDVGQYYYTYLIGISVVYNLLFLLTVFLCSEGVKNYSTVYSVILIVVGLLQIVRIFGFPVDANEAVMPLPGGDTEQVMKTGQFVYTVILLLLSAASCIAAGVIGYIRTSILNNYKKEIGVK